MREASFPIILGGNNSMELFVGLYYVYLYLCGSFVGAAYISFLPSPFFYNQGVPWSNILPLATTYTRSLPAH